MHKIAVLNMYNLNKVTLKSRKVMIEKCFEKVERGNICYKCVNIFDRIENIRVLQYSHKADAQMLKKGIEKRRTSHGKHKFKRTVRKSRIDDDDILSSVRISEYY